MTSVKDRLLREFFEFNFFQEVRTALKIEAQGNGVGRQPFRKLSPHILRNSVRQRDE